MGYVTAFSQEALKLFSRLLDGVFLEFFTDKRTEDYYQAEFTDAEYILSKDYQGICLDGRRCMPPEKPHALVISPSGGGKSTCIVIPTLLKTSGSFLINDPSKELYLHTAGYLQSQGVDVRVINFASETGSDGFNPLAYVRNGSDAQKMTGLLVRNVLPNKNSDPFWSTSATSLISFSIRLLLFHPEECRNFANVRRILQLLSYDTKQVDLLVVGSKSKELIADYKTFLAMEQKVRMSVLATASAAVEIFSDPVLAKVTAHNTIDLLNMRKKRMAIYLHTNTSDFKHYSVLISMLFDSVMKMIMSELPERDDLYIYLVLDELSSMYIPGLENASANLRKGRGSIIGILQSFQQLINIYNREAADSIRSNCFAKVYFPGMDHASAEELSRQLGKYTLFDDNGQPRGTKELLTSDGVRMLEKNNAIILCSNYPPMKVELVPFYENYFLKLKTEITPPTLSGRLPETPVSFIA